MAHPLLNLPPLDALRGFVAAARRLSITAAAQDLCLTQSAVSRQVQALEERLGTPLFVRGNRSIALTDAGRQLFDLTSPWLDRLAELAGALQQDSPRPVTISASIGVATLWILPRLGAFQAAHPDLDLRMATSNRLMDLREDGVDLAIRYAPAAAVPCRATRCACSTRTWYRWPALRSPRPPSRRRTPWRARCCWTWTTPPGRSCTGRPGCGAMACRTTRKPRCASTSTTR